MSAPYSPFGRSFEDYNGDFRRSAQIPSGYIQFRHPNILTEEDAVSIRKHLEALLKRHVRPAPKEEPIHMAIKLDGVSDLKAIVEAIKLLGPAGSLDEWKKSIVENNLAAALEVLKITDGAPTVNIAPVIKIDGGDKVEQLEKHLGKTRDELKAVANAIDWGSPGVSAALNGIERLVAALATEPLTEDQKAVAANTEATRALTAQLEKLSAATRPTLPPGFVMDSQGKLTHKGGLLRPSLKGGQAAYLAEVIEATKALTKAVERLSHRL